MAGGEIGFEAGGEMGILTNPKIFADPVLWMWPAAKYCSVDTEKKDDSSEKKEPTVKVQIEGDPNRKLSQSEIDELIRRLLEIGCEKQSN